LNGGISRPKATSTTFNAYPPGAEALASASRPIAAVVRNSTVTRPAPGDFLCEAATWLAHQAGTDLVTGRSGGPLRSSRLWSAQSLSGNPASGQGGAMPVEDNKQAVQRFYQEVINSRNLDALDELLTPDGVDHTFGSQNPEQAKQFFGMVHQAFPDLHAEVHDVIAEGELVAARVTYTGTHQGEFVGIPATGKRTTLNGVDFFRMQDGRQAEHWGGPDMFSFLVQAGVMPGPGTPGPGTPA
jgi:steroid delta-isomerase-like uncharacterized protein